EMSDPTIFSNFIPTSLNVIRCDNDNDNYKMCIVAMKSGEKICFQGSLLVATIYGDALIMGYRLKSAKSKFLENNFNNFEGEKEMDILFHPVFSPKTHSLLVIDIKASNGIKHCINEMLKKNNEHNILRNGYDTILVFRDIVSWCGIKHLGIVAPIYSDIFIPDDDKYKSNIEKQDFFQIPGFYPIFEMINEEGVTSFKILDSWKHAADEMETGLIKCPKVAYLETDIGQSEFTPEGILSLNIIESPILGVPLIINTHGWVKGMGLDICYENKKVKEEEIDEITLEEFLETERHNLGSNLTPVTFESFTEWKKNRKAKQDADKELKLAAKEAAFKAGKSQGMSGWDLSKYKQDDEVDDNDSDNTEEHEGEQLVYGQEAVDENENRSDNPYGE
ncbi:17689_t:CDS:2, partial [Entrophospora sp. SA101]